MRFEKKENGIRVLAPAKLNLYLDVGPQRADGYHDIDSLFQAITLHDELELDLAPPGVLELEEEGIREAEKNLVHRAARKLLDSPLVPAGARRGARMRLRKRIPEGAGLGGGSSDAAAAILGLTRLWELAPRPGDLEAIAASIGSDVPFFLVGGAARCRGRGELVESWSTALAEEPPLQFVVAYPGVKVPTRTVYEGLDLARGPSARMQEPSPLDGGPRRVWAALRRGEVFFNRFEPIVFRAFPEVARLHAHLSALPFVRVLMSGSGSSVFALARSAREASDLAGRIDPALGARIFTVECDGPAR